MEFVGLVLCVFVLFVLVRLFKILLRHGDNNHERFSPDPETDAKVRAQCEADSVRVHVTGDDVPF